MYGRDSYRNDYELSHASLTARYRDYYERERYDERDAAVARAYRSYSPPLDDPYYRASSRRVIDDPLPLPPSRPSRSERSSGRDMKGAYVQGSVTLAPPSIFTNKNPTREKPSNCNTVFVGTLPEGTTEKHLYDIFCECGTIQDVRIARNKTFGHVEFKSESSVDKAIQLNKYKVIVTLPSGEENFSAIQVDYAQSREISEAKRRMKTGEMLPFNAANAAIIAADLRNEDMFEFSAKNLIQWMEKGSCTAATAGTFFGLLSSVNIHSFKLEKDVKVKDREEDEFLIKKRNCLDQLLVQCNTIESVFEAVFIKKAWDNFTKPQRKSLTQWKDHIKELEGSIKTDIKSCSSRAKSDKSEEPVAKKQKIAMPENDEVNKVSDLESKLNRSEKEIEQLKLDHEIAIEKKEKQILQLKTLLAKFKKNCPDEWEKIIVGGGEGGANNHQELEQQQDTVQLVKGEEGEGEGEDEGEWEVIDGVSMDDLNRALDSGAAGGETLAAAAAAYAQLKTQIGSGADEKGVMSDTEIAIVSVMAVFLTVHPLGASIEEMELYFRTFNINYNSIYLESLLHRLPMIFQQSKTSDQLRWWFMGFQTVSVPSQSYSATANNGSGDNESQEDQNETVEMIDAVTGDNAN